MESIPSAHQYNSEEELHENIIQRRHIDIDEAEEEEKENPIQSSVQFNEDMEEEDEEEDVDGAESSVVDDPSIYEPPLFRNSGPANVSRVEPGRVSRIVEVMRDEEQQPPLNRD